MVQPSDKRVPDYLRRKNEVEKTLVARRVAISDSLMKKSREFLKEYFNTMDIPSDEDGLIACVLKRFTEERDRLQGLLDQEYKAGAYPERNMVEHGVKLCDALLAQKKDNTALLKKMTSMEDDFLDLSEDMTGVLAFFNNQKDIFDRAAALVDSLSKEMEYLQTEREAAGALSRIRAILTMPKPYQSITELPDLMRTVQASYGSLLDWKRQDIYAEIQAALGEIHQTAGLDQQGIVAKADEALGAKKKAASEAATLTQLDAMKIQIANLRQQYLRSLVVVEKKGVDTVTANRSSICYTMKLESEADVDKYVANIKAKLMGMLKGHDALHII